MVVRPPTLTPTPRYPMRLTSSTASLGAVSEYFPWSSVTALVVVPRMRTVAPRMRSPSGAVTFPETSTCWPPCWPNAGPHSTSANSTLIATAPRWCSRLVADQRLPCSMSLMGAPSSCGSSHGLQALLGDQLAIGSEHYVPGLHGPGKPVRRQRIQLSLTILAHLGERLVGVHVLQRAQLRIVYPDVGDHDIETGLQAIDHRHQAVRLLARRGRVLRRIHRLAEVFRHAETEFARQPLRDLTKLGGASRGAHVIVDVVDLEPRPPRPLDLRPQLLFDLSYVGMILVEGFGRLEEVSVGVDQPLTGARHVADTKRQPGRRDGPRPPATAGAGNKRRVVR